jgi:Transglutaminase elicitor
MSSRVFVLPLLMLTGVIGCSSALEEPPATSPIGQVADAERWDAANEPMRLDASFKLRVSTLPLQGAAARTPIPAHYWPTAEDSINARWDGAQSLSPAEKYERAFGRPGVAQLASEQLGIRGQASRQACNDDAECDGLGDDSICAIPQGTRPAGWAKAGRCIPMWWGICHGWAPYAMSEPAPTKTVVKNGVTFYPADVAALMSAAYSKGVPSKFLSSRCNRGSHTSSAPDRITVDATGRVIEGECRDMNPGSFHVLAANMLGLRGASFVYDRTVHSEVWNQPVRDFRVTNAVNGGLREITKSQAAQLLGRGTTPAFQSVLSNQPLARYASESGIFRATQTGELVFRANGSSDVDLFLKKGSVASTSNFDCASASGKNFEECRINVVAGEDVNYTLLAFQQSDVSLAVGQPDGAQSAYTLNPAAVRFFHVKVDLRYIAEPQPSRTPASFDENTFTDQLEYILEANKDGDIEGGEWVGLSRMEHPDFAWWPSVRLGREQSVAGMLFGDLIDLNTQSAGVAR